MEAWHFSEVDVPKGKLRGTFCNLVELLPFFFLSLN
jgi:hypothetical protein